MKEAILGIIFHPAVEMVLLAALGLFIKGFKKYRKLVKEAIDIPQAIMAARDKNSPGGTEITEAEWAKIGKQVVETLQIGAPLFKKKV